MIGFLYKWLIFALTAFNVFALFCLFSVLTMISVGCFFSGLFSCGLVCFLYLCDIFLCLGRFTSMILLKICSMPFPYIFFYLIYATLLHLCLAWLLFVCVACLFHCVFGEYNHYHCDFLKLSLSTCLYNRVVFPLIVTIHSLDQNEATIFWKEEKMWKQKQKMLGTKRKPIL